MAIKETNKVHGHLTTFPESPYLIRSGLMSKQSNSKYFILVKANAASSFPHKQTTSLFIQQETANKLVFP